MTKLVFAALATVGLGSAAAAATIVQPLDFTRDGVHYIGTVTVRADGTRLIAGHEEASGRSFALEVANGLVTGQYDFSAVNYAAPRPRKATQVAVTAATTPASTAAGF